MKRARDKENKKLGQPNKYPTSCKLILIMLFHMAI